MKTRLSTFLVAIPTLFLIANCTHYHVGTPSHLPFASLYIAPVANKSLAAQAQHLLSEQLRAEFTAFGARLPSVEADSEATLKVTVIEIKRSVSATQPDDTARARSFLVTMRAECTLINNHNGKVFLRERLVEASSHTFTDSGQQPAEYQTMPILTKELAKKIRDLVTGTW